MLRKGLVGELPVQFERELTYMNYVYFKTQCGFELFENLGKLPALRSEIQLFLRHRAYCRDRFKRESTELDGYKKKLENPFMFKQMRSELNLLVNPRNTDLAAN